MSKYTDEYTEWCQEATCEADGKFVRNVLLCGNQSRNGYAIPESAFGRGASTLYEGKPVYLDHSPAGTEHNRSVRDLVGHVVGVRMEGGRPRGDIHVLDTESGNLFLSLAKEKRRGLGMSHVAMYKFNKGRTSVEAIEDVISVDVVCGPATTKTFTEQTKTGDTTLNETEIKALQDRLVTAEAELKVAKADLESVRAKLETADKALATVTTERDTLKAQADKLAVKESVRAELAAAGLDPADKDLCSEAFIGLLETISDPAARKIHIEDRAKLKKESTLVIGQGAGRNATEGKLSFEAMLPPGVNLFD